MDKDLKCVNAIDCLVNDLYDAYKEFKDINTYKIKHFSNEVLKRSTTIEFLDVNCIPSIRLHNNDDTCDLSRYFLNCLEEYDVKNLFKDFISVTM